MNVPMRFTVPARPTGVGRQTKTDFRGLISGQIWSAGKTTWTSSKCTIIVTFPLTYDILDPYQCILPRSVSSHMRIKSKRPTARQTKMKLPSDLVTLWPPACPTNLATDTRRSFEGTNCRRNRRHREGESACTSDNSQRPDEELEHADRALQNLQHQLCGHNGGDVTFYQADCSG